MQIYVVIKINMIDGGPQARTMDVRRVGGGRAGGHTRVPRPYENVPLRRTPLGP